MQSKKIHYACIMTAQANSVQEHYRKDDTTSSSKIRNDRKDDTHCSSALRSSSFSRNTDMRLQVHLSHGV